jgi:AcrR family transcriptional regulator
MVSEDDMAVDDSNGERATWRERERERARETILHAAADTFAESGFAKTSMKEVAARAGISVGMLYNYFKGKDEIYRELIEHYFTHLHEKADAECNPDDPPIEQILCRIGSAIEFYWENRSLAMMYLHENPLRLEYIVKGWEERTRSVIADLLSSAMERGDIVKEDSMTIAAMIVGGIHRMVYMMVKDGKEEKLRTIPEIIHRIVLKPLERERDSSGTEDSR